MLIIIIVFVIIISVILIIMMVATWLSQEKSIDNSHLNSTIKSTSRQFKHNKGKTIQTKQSKT